MIKYSRLATIIKNGLDNGSISNIRVIMNEDIKKFIISAFPITVSTIELTDEMLKDARYAIYSLNDNIDIIYVHIYSGEPITGHDISYAVYNGKETYIVYKFWNFLTDDNLVEFLFSETKRLIELISPPDNHTDKALFNIFKQVLPVAIIGNALCVHDSNSSYRPNDLLADLKPFYQENTHKIIEYIIGSIKGYSIKEMIDECQIYNSIKQGLKDGRKDNDNMA